MKVRGRGEKGSRERGCLRRRTRRTGHKSIIDKNHIHSFDTRFDDFISESPPRTWVGEIKISLPGRTGTHGGNLDAQNSPKTCAAEKGPAKFGLA